MRIAICCPVHGDTKALFTLCLARMLIRTAKTRFRNQDGSDLEVDLQVFLGSSSILPKVRQDLADNAIKWGADWILWLDSDHTFPTDALLRLLSHRKSVVGCNYLDRFGHKPVALYPEKDGVRYHVPTTREKAGHLEEVDYTGLGLCLVSADAIKSAERPHFGYQPEADGSVATGEDAWFFRRLRAAGHPAFLDHALSLDIGHIASQVLTFADSPTDTPGVPSVVVG